jgi:hypothetical protein
VKRIIVRLFCHAFFVLAAVNTKRDILACGMKRTALAAYELRTIAATVAAAIAS